MIDGRSAAAGDTAEAGDDPNAAGLPMFDEMRFMN
jgi:hypothetical protein